MMLNLAVFRTFFIVGLGLILLALPNGWQVSSLTAQVLTGSVGGTVFDENEAVIPDAKVVIHSSNVRQTTYTDVAGRYRFVVPPGVYNITTDLQAYHPFRRSEFNVSSNASLEVNIYPPLRLLSAKLKMTKAGLTDLLRTAPAPKYETIAMPNSSSLSLLIRFRHRRNTKTFVEYSEAMASFDAISIHADKLRVYKSSHKVVVDYNGIVEDGSGRFRASQINLEFRSNQPPRLQLIGARKI